MNIFFYIIALGKIIINYK